MKRNRTVPIHFSPRNDIGDAHRRAGRRGRRPLPRSTPHPHGRARRPRRAVAHGTPSGTPTGARAAGTSAPTTHRATSAHAHRAPHTHAMRAPGPARRPRRAVAHGTSTERHRGRPRARGPPGRRPQPRSAPCPHTRAARRTHTRHARTRTPCAHLVRRDVLGAPLPTRTPSGTPTCTRAAGDVGPYHAPRHVRTRTACLPCQRIETLMGFRNAVAKSRTRACHAFASFTAPAPLQVAPAQ